MLFPKKIFTRRRNRGNHNGTGVKPPRRGAPWWITSTPHYIMAIAAALIIALGVFEFRKTDLIVEPINVPDEVAKDGFTPDVVAARLIDQIQKIFVDAKAAKPSGSNLTLDALV